MFSENSKLAFCWLVAVPMRAMPSHRAEMVNQLLQDDTVELLDKEGEWLKVRSLYDGYEGWVNYKQLRSGEAPRKPFAAWHSSDPVTEAEGFLGTPYLWGGRTAAGIDCSGLMQVAFGRCGIWLPRDASQQAGCGEEVPFEALRRGDLAFFSNAEGKIVHVGVATGDGKIVHSSGWVRKEPLERQGIVDQTTGQYSHHFALARRIEK